jgi:hypothetical protein
MAGLIFHSSSAAADKAVCGEPPVVEDIDLKGQIEGKARILSGLVGDSTLRGQTEVARRDVLSRYPNADRLRLNQYFLYVVCSAIMIDTTMSTAEKLNQVRAARNEIFPTPAPVSQIRIESNGMWIGNTAIGDVSPSSSTIEFQIDGEYETDFRLSQPFEGFEKDLQHGAHILTYKVDVRARSGLRVRGTCSVVFNVRGRQIFNPQITLVPHDNDRGRISSCSLRAAT